jgi:biopolymer transport protein ExbB
MINSFLHTVAQATPSPGGGSIVSTVWEMVLRGGWFMVPIASCSLVALTVIVERVIVTRRTRIVPRALLETLTSLRHKPTQALARCAKDPSPLAAVILAGIKARGLKRELQEKAISEAGERELAKLRQRMRLLSSLPQVATMLGLLGTVLGMIRTFTVVAASGESLGKTERLAQGIHEAWTATAGGLVIAVPTLLAFHIIMGRIDAAATALDAAARLWLDADADAAAIDVLAAQELAQIPGDSSQPELAASAV